MRPCQFEGFHPVPSFQNLIALFAQNPADEATNDLIVVYEEHSRRCCIQHLHPERKLPGTSELTQPSADIISTRQLHIVSRCILLAEAPLNPSFRVQLCRRRRRIFTTRSGDSNRRWSVKRHDLTVVNISLLTTGNLCRDSD